MYNYYPPKPIIIKLTDDLGFRLRNKAADYIKGNLNITGAERGSQEQQGFGALAQIVIRNKLGLTEIVTDYQDISYDILLDSGVKIDIKCRGGDLPFQEEYSSSDNIPREAKHNLFARQVYDESLNTDIYLMTHLETPKNKTLPGTKRQKKWILYVCGWVSKKRAKREGVYLPRGSLTERGRSWFQYRGQEIEFYNKNLNGLNCLEEILKIETKDVKKDEEKRGGLNITSVDAIRIIYDLIGHDILNKDMVNLVSKELGMGKIVKPILHPNQYFHLLDWLKENKQITEEEIKKAQKIMSKEPYTGI